MSRVTFGVASSPFLATQALQQLATDFEPQIPSASKVLRKSFYVDDCLTGADSKLEATALQQSLTQLLEKRNFQLRKWSSNSSKVQ